MITLNQTRRVIGALVIAASVGACNDFISPTDVNPNSVPEAQLSQLFTGIQVSTYFFSEAQLSRLSAIWTQQMSGTDRQFASLDNYLQLTEETADDDFNLLYTGGGLIDLKQAIAAAEDAGRQSYAGILKIYQAYLFGMGASIYGDLPYSEAARRQTYMRRSRAFWTRPSVTWPPVAPGRDPPTSASRATWPSGVLRPTR
jgi:hypothetical protein